MNLPLDRLLPFFSVFSLFSYFLFDGMVVSPAKRAIWIAIVLLAIGADLLYQLFTNKFQKQSMVKYTSGILGLISFASAFLRDFLDFGYRPGLNQEASALGRFRDFLLVLAVISSFAFLIQTILLELGHRSLQAQSDLSKTKRSLVQNALLGFLIVLPLLVAVNYFAIQRNYNFDLSSKGKFSVSETGRSILKALDKEVKILAFYPRPLEADGPENSLSLSRIRPDLEILLEQVRSTNGNIKLEFINADVEVDRLAEIGQASNGTILIRANKSILLGSEIPYLEEKIFVREVTDLKDLERRLISAIYTVTTKEKKAYFLSSNGEHFGLGFNNIPNEQVSKFKAGLQYLNFKVEEWGFSNGWPGQLPENADLILAIGPSLPYSDEAKKALLGYILEKNGNLIATIDPKGGESFQFLIDKAGLVFDKTQLGEVNDRPGLIVAKGISSHQSLELLPKKELGVVFPYSGFFIAKSDGSAPFSFKTKILLDSGGVSFVDKNGNGKLDSEEKKDTVNLAYEMTPLSLDDSKQGKVLIHSGTSWLTDQYFGYNMNSNYALAIANGMFLDNSIAGIPPKKEEIQTVTLSDNQKLLVWAVGVFLYPGLIIGIGSFYVASRRRVSEA